MLKGWVFFLICLLVSSKVSSGIDTEEMLIFSQVTVKRLFFFRKTRIPSSNIFIAAYCCVVIQDFYFGGSETEKTNFIPGYT